MDRAGGLSDREMAPRKMMTDSAAENHLAPFVEKMAQEGIPAPAIEAFSGYYRQIHSGATGLLHDRDIQPVAPESLVHADHLGSCGEKGRRVLPHTVIIKLNGGLGTSMGLKTAKSLLPVKDGRTFLDIIVAQAAACGAELALMNSFNTQADTQAALDRIRPRRPPVVFFAA